MRIDNHGFVLQSFIYIITVNKIDCSPNLYLAMLLILNQEDPLSQFWPMRISKSRRKSSPSQVLKNLTQCRVLIIRVSNNDWTLRGLGNRIWISSLCSTRLGARDKPGLLLAGLAGGGLSRQGRAEVRAGGQVAVPYLRLSGARQ